MIIYRRHVSRVLLVLITGWRRSEFSAGKAPAYLALGATPKNDGPSPSQRLFDLSTTVQVRVINIAFALISV